MKVSEYFRMIPRIRVILDINVLYQHIIPTNILLVFYDPQFFFVKISVFNNMYLKHPIQIRGNVQVQQRSHKRPL